MEIPHRVANQLFVNACDENDAVQRRRYWAVVYGLVPYLDGNQWCVLLGPNLQEGICGFGSSPHLAIIDFERAMEAKAA